MSNWISVDDKMPDSGVNVLLRQVNPNGYTCCIIGRYFGKFELEANSDMVDDEVDYCEINDEYYCPAGWYESIENWNDYSAAQVSEGEITHWQSKPNMEVE